MFPDGTTDQTANDTTTSDTTTNDATANDTATNDATANMAPNFPFVKDSTLDTAASGDALASAATDGTLNVAGGDVLSNAATSNDALASAAFGSLAVWTHHNDNANTGANLTETTLTTSNVTTGTFKKLCEHPVDGQIYAQLLYVSNVNIPNKGIHNVVYAATMANSVYAYDADDTNQAAQPLWHVPLHPAIQLPDGGIAGGGSGYNDIAVEVGIVSTPVISLENHAIYVVAATKDAGGYAHYLHALDLSTGKDLFKGPTKLQGSVKGTGYRGDHIVNGQVVFMSNKQIQRSALLLANGNVYIAFASYEDSDPYHGWIMAYDAKTLKQVAIYNTTPNGGRGGIWQAGRGPAADDQGNVYVLTGNGDTNHDGTALSDSLIKLSPQLKVLDWFIPYNHPDLNGSDNDLGSSGPLLMPNTNFVIGGGKEGKVFVFNSQNLGKFVSNTNNNSQILQWFYVTPPDDLNRPYVMDYGKTHHLHAGPVCWTGPMGMWIYVWPETDVLKAYQAKNGRFFTTPIAARPLPPGTPQGNNSPGTGNHPVSFPGGFLGALASKAINLQQSDTIAMPGGALSISANGNQAGTGIVWASHPHNLDIAHQIDANQHIVPGILHAYNAEDLTKELWNSEMNGADSIGNFAKFNAPTIANGKVYLASFGRGSVKQNAALTPQDRTTFKATSHFAVYGLK